MGQYFVEVAGVVREVFHFDIADKAAQMKAFILDKEATVFQINERGEIEPLCIWSRQ